MDQMNKEQALKFINDAIGDAVIIEHVIEGIRENYGPSIHPWAMPSLVSALGSIQHAIGDLKSAKHHIEAPEPAIEVEFERK